MNFLDIFDKIAKADPEIYDRMDTRRKAMSSFAGMAGKVTAAAMPLALGSMFTKAYGKPNDAVLDTLGLALQLERLELAVYQLAIDGGGFSGNELAGLRIVLLDEQHHRDFLISTITAGYGAGSVPAQPNIDPTGGKGNMNGPFMGFLNSRDTALAVIQVFEDTGVRAYKGQATNLLRNEVYLTAALNIHSVEARHAAYIRKLRGIKPWITGKAPQTGATADPLVQGNYNAGADAAKHPAEDNVIQGGVNLQTALSYASVANLSESFDEPLSGADVLKLVGTPGAGVGNMNSMFFY